ncbi:unnamed protein product [Phytophthora lilii]|uniref:Unnamed protein product n=1 Tax=Phytophthora lilii TaxID=2077276 RepID=A0A9W7CPB3_9STRA|nr:unnamed protein product [Phytophthora lilii]
MATECFAKSFHDRWTKVLNACLAMQLTHCGGKYSIERTLALDEYIQNTSLLHVVLVAFTPPVFMLTVVVCQESIPLQDPTAGWKANYGFWVRVEILGVAIGCLVSSQFKAWLGVPGLSARQLPTFCIVCRHLETGHRLSNRRIKVRSCIPHHLSGLSMAQLNRLGGSTLHRLHYGGGVSLSSILPQENPGQARTIQLNLPASAMTDHQQNLHVYEEENLRCASSVGDSSDILEEALKALFTSECLILAEYLEFMIPSYYGSFVVVMVHLPSAQYHSEMIEVNKQNVGSTVSWMFIHALLEFASFLGLSVIMSRNCGIHALYQLAFVLETQISLVLSKLVLWMLLTPTYRVLHFGTFRWLSVKSAGLTMRKSPVNPFVLQFRCRFFLSQDILVAKPLLAGTAHFPIRVASRAQLQLQKTYFANTTAMEPTAAVTTSIAGKVYEGVISVVSYFALEYTSNWNWHLEDLGALIPVGLFGYHHHLTQKLTENFPWQAAK